MRAIRHLRGTLAGVALACASASALAAQQPAASPADSLRVGQRVRVHLVPRPEFVYDRDRFDGELARLDADSVIVMERGRRIALSRATVQRLDVRTRQRSRGRMVLARSVLGLGIGATTLGALSYATYRPMDCAMNDPNAWCLEIFDRGDHLALGALVGGGLGLGAGALWGALGSRDEWRPVRLPADARITLVPAAAGTRVAVSLRF